MSNTKQLPLFREEAVANLTKDILPVFLEEHSVSYYGLAAALGIMTISLALLLTAASIFNVSIVYGRVEFEKAVQDIKLSHVYIKDVFVSESSSVEIGDMLFSMYRTKSDYEDRELVNADLTRQQDTLKLLETETEQLMRSKVLLRSTYELDTSAVKNEITTIDSRLETLNASLSSIEKIVNRIKDENSVAISKLEHEEYIDKIRAIKINIINERQKKENLLLNYQSLTKKFESEQLQIEQREIQIKKNVIGIQRDMDILKRKQLFVARSEIDGRIDFLNVKKNHSLNETVLAARIIPKEVDKVIIVKLPTNLPFELNVGDTVRIFSSESYINNIRFGHGLIRSISQSVNVEADTYQSYDVKVELNNEDEFHAGEKVGIIATFANKPAWLSVQEER